MVSGYQTNVVNQYSGAYGLIQWTAGRYNNLVEFAAGRGTDISDMVTQLEFIGHEFKPMLDGYSRTQGYDIWASVSGSNDIRYVTEMVCIYYMGPQQNLSQRQAKANEFLVTYFK